MIRRGCRWLQARDLDLTIAVYGGGATLVLAVTLLLEQLDWCG